MPVGRRDAASKPSADERHESDQLAFSAAADQVDLLAEGRSPRLEPARPQPRSSFESHRERIPLCDELRIQLAELECDSRRHGRRSCPPTTVIDLHSHILPGIDDGAASLAESLALARAAVADGITAIAATPHVRSDFPTSAERMEELVDELRAALASEQIPLELHRGGEVALDRLHLLQPAEVRRFALAGSRYVLTEFPYGGWPLDLQDRIFRLQLDGLVPVLAHPERNAEVKADLHRLAPLVAAGALVQITAASIDGRLGRTTQRVALELVSEGLAHLIASDAHTPSIREVGMRAAVEVLADAPLAAWLTHDVPAAIVADEPPPPRPASLPARRSRWSLRRG
ncbi:MAG TPA: CpsB/CapC family capsule biosynthesis tyrosine phosphatase [Gaiellaceae bacterium]|nr:CpsB/CapC family capsule biosynthesis tyrosine phosphatase [Gaiellaceae bacterium]